MTGAHPTVNGGPHLRTVDIGDTPTEQLSLIPKDDGTPVGRAIEELNRLIADFKIAHREGEHLRALSNLVALQPHGHLLSITRIANTETGDNEDGNHIGEGCTCERRTPLSWSNVPSRVTSVKTLMNLGSTLTASNMIQNSYWPNAGAAATGRQRPRIFSCDRRNCDSHPSRRIHR